MLTFPYPAQSEPLPGPIPAQVIRVIDGDTLLVRAKLWPGLTQETYVRIAEIDAPEMKGKCEAERTAAEKAREALLGLVGERIDLRDIHPGKYARRVVARVITVEEVDVGNWLLGEGLVLVYGKGGGWCG